ncbi:MAG: sulfatase [Candidatus Omnitrophota bacterium]
MNRKSSRRNFLELLGTGLAAAALSASPSWTASGKKSNFVVILADDLGYGDIEGFGSLELPYKTPHLSRMASEGVKLTQVYVPVPYCAPSRSSLLTGRYPFRNGVVFNPSPDAGINDVGLDPSEITIADALKTAGYACSCIGKWHLGHKPQFLPRRQGFDEYFGILYSNDMRPVQMVENETIVEYPVFQPTLTKRYTERAVDFIRRCHQADQPFFLYLPHAMPHKPLAASEEFYTPDTPSDLYADVIRELDASVGKILQTVKELGADENTLVIFASDNGPWYGGSAGGLRGMKAKTWDGGLRIPFIARWPGKIPAGIVNHSVAGNIDAFPTLLKLAGVDLPNDRIIDGEDIWPLLTSPDALSPHEAVIGMSGANLAIVRSGKWKLHIINPGGVPNRGDDWIDPRGPDGVTLVAQFEQARPADYPGVIGGDGPKAMMLFDMEADPSEQRDVSEDHPDMVKRLHTYAQKVIAEMPEFDPPKRDFQGMRRLTGGTLESAYPPK